MRSTRGAASISPSALILGPRAAAMLSSWSTRSDRSATSSSLCAGEDQRAQPQPPRFTVRKPVPSRPRCLKASLQSGPEQRSYTMQAGLWGCKPPELQAE